MKFKNLFVGSRKYDGASIFSIVMAYVVLVVVAAIMIYPMLLLINTSFKLGNSFLVDPMSISTVNIFNKETYANYVQAWNDLEVLRKFFVTLIMTLTASILTVIISVMAAFPLSRNHFKHSNKVYVFFLMSMFFPGSLVATIFLMQILGLYDNPIGVILLWSFGGLATNIFIMVGFVKSIPRELDDAAIIDGCSYFKYIFTVAMPLMKPIVATVFVLKMIGSWNDFVTPYIFLTTKEFRTL